MTDTIILQPVNCLDRLHFSSLVHWNLLPIHMEIEEDRDSAAKRYLDSLRKKTQAFAISDASEQDGYEWLLLSHKLDWDSNFFQLETGRLELVPPSINSISSSNISTAERIVQRAVNKLKEDGFKLLTVQIDPRDSAAIKALEGNGFFMVDTNIGFQLSLEAEFKFQCPNIRHARPEDDSTLRKISADCFSDRSQNVNRFNSDLAFSIDTVRSFYDEWARKSLTYELADAVLVYEENGKAVGFITISNSDDFNGFASIPLNAVSKDHQGKGIYSKLVRAALSWLLDENKAKQVRIRTQISNLAVQGCWQSFGARIFTIFHTFQKHIERC